MIQINFSGDINNVRAEIIAMAATLGGMARDTAPAAEVDTKKPRATKKAEPDVVPTPPPTPAPAPQATAPAIPSDQEVQAALVKVSEKHGIEKAIECLAKFNVKRGRELTDAQKQPFVEHCNGLLA